MLKKREILPVLAAIITLTMAHPVTAGGYNCVFPTNCYESTGCDTDRLLVVEIDESDGNQPSLVLPGMTLKAVKQIDEMPGVVSGTVSYVSNLERNTVHLLTIFEGGSARFASHTYLNGALALVSRGTCEPS